MTPADARQADRLRLIGVNGSGFRVYVVAGEVVVDGSLKYDPKDVNTAKKAGVTVVAYVVDKAVLYTINLDYRTATKIGEIGGLPTVRDIAIVIN